MSESSTLIRDDLSTEEGAYLHARDLAKRAVAYQRLDSDTKEAAIGDLSETGEFGSWLRKLHRGDRVTVHLHLYHRLLSTVEALAEKHERRAAHERWVLQQIRGRNAARHGGDAAGRGVGAATAGSV